MIFTGCQPSSDEGERLVLLAHVPDQYRIILRTSPTMDSMIIF